MTNEAILYEQSGNIVTITYNRPDQQNAINGQMRKELNAAWDKFNEDESAWVAILTGSGNVFCGGADLRDPAGSTGDFKGTFWEKPTINSFESGKERLARARGRRGLDSPLLRGRSQSGPPRTP